MRAQAGAPFSRVDPSWLPSSLGTLSLEVGMGGCPPSRRLHPSPAIRELPGKGLNEAKSRGKGEPAWCQLLGQGCPAREPLVAVS